MIDDDTIKRLADTAGLMAGQHWRRDAMRTQTMRDFARAVWSLGRDAGLAEAQRACEPYGKVGKVIAISIGARRALTENKHER